MKNTQIFLAVDSSNYKEAQLIIKETKNFIHGLKLGLEFFTQFGPYGIKKMQEFSLPIFLDLKIKDILTHQAGLASWIPFFLPLFCKISSVCLIRGDERFI